MTLPWCWQLLIFLFLPADLLSVLCDETNWQVFLNFLLLYGFKLAVSGEHYVSAQTKWKQGNVVFLRDLNGQTERLSELL